MDEVASPNATRVLVLDSCTFIAEAGLTSVGASALRHYLHVSNVQLVVPRVVVEECKRHLLERVKRKIDDVERRLTWLARFFDGVKDWRPPPDADIAARIDALSRGEHFEARVLNEAPSLQQRACQRVSAQRPPSHKKDSEADCIIWEHCLALLRGHDVVFVSQDEDFRGHGQSKELHPQLRAEADDVRPQRALAFHTTVDGLLADMRTAIQPPSELGLMDLVYASEEVTTVLAEDGRANPTRTGSVEQSLFATDDPAVVEVRFKMKDALRGADVDAPAECRVVGKCTYRPRDLSLGALSVSRCELLGALGEPIRTHVYLSVSDHLGAARRDPVQAHL